MIYIVEDDAAIRELEQYALQSSGYGVQSFETSEPFWQAMRAAEPELVILDVMLPGEDGFSILKKLRNTPALRRLPIIMVTAKSSELDTVRGLDCGADDYITKPFGIMEFLSRVRAALRRSAPEEKQNVYAFHEILLDNARHSVTVNGTHIDLTYIQAQLGRHGLCHRLGVAGQHHGLAHTGILQAPDGLCAVGLHHVGDEQITGIHALNGHVHDGAGLAHSGSLQAQLFHQAGVAGGSFPAISSATPNFAWRARFPYRDTQPRSTFSAGRRERRTDMFSTAVTLRSPTVRH